MTEENISVEQATLAAVLHDIGKLFMRADDQPRHARHESYSHAYATRVGLVEDVCEAIQKHHARRTGDQAGIKDTDSPLAWVVYEADNIASSTRVKTEEKFTFNEEISLASVFNFLRVSDEPQANSKEWYRHRPVPLASEISLADYLPEKGLPITRAQYEKLRRRWEEITGKPYFAHVPNAYLNLLQYLASFIPADTNENSTNDLSLYDHLKVTAAIAAAMASYFNKKGLPQSLNQVTRRDEKRYLLTVGDISGVQNFVYRTASKRALKMLRSRSFYLEILTEVTALSIVTELGLSRANIIFTGGGGFQLLLPNTDEAIDLLKNKERSINDFLAERFNRELYLALGNAPASAHDLGAENIVDSDSRQADGVENSSRFSEVLQRARRELQQKKTRKFEHQLTEIFTAEPSDADAICAYCYRIGESSQMDSLEEQAICSDCRRFSEARLAQAELLVLNQATDDFDYEFPDGDTLALIKEEQLAAQFVHVFCVNSFDNDILWTEKSASPLMLGNLTAKKKGDAGAKEFGDMASDSFGANMLAVLKMDVDNLGILFSRGLSHTIGSQRIDTFNRYAAVSQSLNFFFKYLINRAIEDEPLLSGSESLPAPQEPNNVTVIYSGGDDVLIAGGWHDVLWAAIKIRRALLKFTGANPDLTLSAGLAVREPHFPIYRFANEADLAEQAAKEYWQPCRQKNCSVLWGDCAFLDSEDMVCGRKDAITLFEAPPAETSKIDQSLTMRWADLDTALADFCDISRGYNFMRVVGLFAAYASINGSLKFELPRGFNHRLRTTLKDFEKRSWLALPPLVYLLSRMADTRVDAGGARVSVRKTEGWGELSSTLKQTRFMEEMMLPVLDYLHLAQKTDSESEGEG